MEYQINIDCEKAIREGKLYDFISNCGNDFSKNDLIALIKELDYGITKANILPCEKQAIYESIADELENQR